MSLLNLLATVLPLETAYLYHINPTSFEIVLQDHNALMLCHRLLMRNNFRNKYKLPYVPLYFSEKLVVSFNNL